MRHAMGWLAGVGLLAAGSPAAAGFVNGGFETGDLTGWTTVTGADPFRVQTAGRLTVLSGPGVVDPVEGDWFAYLLGREANVYTTLSQSFAAAAGDAVTFRAYFDTFDSAPGTDDGYVRVLDAAGAEVATPFAAGVATFGGNSGTTGWVAAGHTFAAGGTYTLEAGVRNAPDDSFTSVLGLDAVQLTPAATPAPATLAVLPAAAAALGLARRRAGR